MENELCDALTEDNILNTIPPELRGRIEQTVILDPFTENDYKNIIHGEYSPVIRAEERLKIPIKISDKMADDIAHKAFVAKTGVRSMNNEINRYINNVLFDDPDTKSIYIE